MKKSKKEVLLWIIIGLIALSVGMLICFTKTKSVTTRVISDMPETKRIERIEGKGLEAYATTFTRQKRTSIQRRSCIAKM